ncbi:MAG: hypothetical protein LBN97_09225 [Oscillospiraceae bacterium]|jgi:uncharacterized membrane protein YesL|nr:hypothetical protein [Oscillospiraceae bacterium]
MALFGNYKYKDKPDLLPDGPEKNGFVIFWEIIGRKFGKLIIVNLIYFALTFPMMIVPFLNVSAYYNMNTAATPEAVVDIFPGASLLIAPMTAIPPTVSAVMLIVSVILYGPATMGLTYILRNFAQQKHAWISDFFSRAWSNFRQGLCFGLLDVLVFVSLANGILGNLPGAGNSVAIMRALCIVALVIYWLMRHYFYTMAVTIDLSVIQIIRNSLMFVLLGFWRNLVAVAVSLGLFFFVFLAVPLITVFAWPLIFYSFTGFAVVFVCYPIIDKYIVSRVNGENKEAE